jgi:sarcosine oxidase, subunit beta
MTELSRDRTLRVAEVSKEGVVVAGEIPKSADVVVIGGGSVGCCSAYHLARMGAGRVVLLERESIASGSTGHSAGMFHQQYGSELLIRLAVESRLFLEEIAAEKDLGVRLHQNGYVHILFKPEELEKAKSLLPLQHRLGAEVEILSPAQVEALVPGLIVDDIVGATNCRTDGWVDPHLATNAFAEMARRAGAAVFVNTEVTGLRTDKGAVQAVVTPRGEIATPLVINAAGPWAALVGQMAGVTVPVKPFRRHLWFTQGLPTLRPEAPIIFDTPHDFYFRPEAPGAVACVGRCEGSTFSTQADWSLAPDVAEAATKRFPPMAEAGLASVWAAPRDISPDHQSILGFLPELRGFFAAAGHSGHGFLMAPAMGRTVAEVVLTGKSSPDISSLGIERFAERDLPDEVYCPLGI